MKRIRLLLVHIDGWQRRSRPIGLAYAVIKKFGDDNANQFVVALGWYGFVAIYPLLLVVITIFGFIGAASLGHQIVSTLHEFPVIGSQFNPERSSKSLQGSGLGLAIGLIGLIYGAQGVTQTIQQAMAGLWNVPQVERPGFAPRLVRSLVALGTIGVAFVLNAVAGTFVTDTSQGLGVRAPAFLGTLVLNAALYFAVFRVATPSRVATRDLVPGAGVASLGFTLLITIGAGLVQHQLRHSSAVYGQFGLVIGLVGFLFLLAKVSLYGAELNPVVSRHLWPRGLLESDPTEADNQVLSDIAHQYRLREDQRIGVGFGEDAADGAARDVRRQIQS
ncbi:MAG TPA: YhjD/YihY/BrkB family envelope integrity protein [Acidimicrobiales bacterium]|jgi:YihY family inner membrane protein|nr:YhjD/YihY/BrkB family envelope integrity protein [Acidimicrobiales bacterium]